MRDKTRKRKWFNQSFDKEFLDWYDRIVQQSPIFMSRKQMLQAAMTEQAKRIERELKEAGKQ